MPNRNTLYMLSLSVLLIILGGQMFYAEAKEDEGYSSGYIAAEPLNNNKTELDWVFSKPANVYFTKSEITVLQYKKCINAGGCKRPKSRCELYNNLGHTERGNHPMNCVNYYAAEEFCEWAGGRLPTAEEWFAEASNGKSRQYPWGNEPATCKYAVMHEGEDGCGKKSTWPVCSKSDGNSVSGLCDMSGNVREWTSSYKRGNRIMCGSGLESSYEGELKASQQTSPNPSYISDDYGFRCARESDENNSQGKRDKVENQSTDKKGSTIGAPEIPEKCDGGEGIWIDKKTYLIWQNPPAERKMDWDTAKEYCNKLKLSGCNKWRLPTTEELTSLLSKTNPATVALLRAKGVDACLWKEGLIGPCKWYWTSDKENIFVSPVSVYFSTGTAWSGNSQNDEGNVRCVRRL